MKFFGESGFLRCGQINFDFVVFWLLWINYGDLNYVFFLQYWFDDKDYEK